MCIRVHGHYIKCKNKRALEALLKFYIGQFGIIKLIPTVQTKFSHVITAAENPQNFTFRKPMM